MRDEAEVVEVEREVKARHPDDGAAAQCIQPIEPARCVSER